MGERTNRRVQFDAIETHADLIAWSRRYCARAIAVHDVDVDLATVEFTVSTRARRRAAAVKTPPVEGAVVGEPIDWEDHDRDGAPPNAELSLSWAAFAAFDRSEWRDTLRHELVHLEQFRRYGTTDHGAAFRERAAELDAAVHCRRFADARYVLRCEECESVVARRYRASKLVKRPDRYRSTCCAAVLSCVERD